MELFEVYRRFHCNDDDDDDDDDDDELLSLYCLINEYETNDIKIRSIKN